MKPHFFGVRVYYEDTDCMGVVYHASYVRFLERARTEMVAASGVPVSVWAERGLMFPVYTLNMTFRAPARLGEDLTVRTEISRNHPVRLAFHQHIVNAKTGVEIVDAVVEVVCTTLDGRLRRLPKGLFASEGAAEPAPA